MWLDDLEEEFEQIEKEASLRDEKEREQFRQMLQDPKTRAWLWRLLSYCRVFNTLSSPDVHSMAIFSGRRDAGLWVLNEIFQSDVNAFNLMQKEAIEGLHGTGTRTDTE